jgi:prephenate dehydrogenase
MAATHTLPQLMAAALLNATIDQPGWREGRKVAGRAYAEVTSPIAYFSQPKTLGKSATLNRESVIRMVDGVIATLQTLRNDIDTDDCESLEARLERARKGRELWWRQRQAADWAAEEMPASATPTGGSEFFGRLFGMRSRKKPNSEDE